jgi:hypothetical protein
MVLLSLVVAELVLLSVWLVSAPVWVVVLASVAVLLVWPVMRLPDWTVVLLSLLVVVVVLLSV